MKFYSIIAACLVSLLLCTPAQAQITTPRTETTLLSDVATITPERPFWAVLHIKLKDGWHTYWKNPGDSGTAPILNWTLPSGFKAGEIEYLTPERLPSGPLMDYGYNDDAYYFIPIMPPSLMNQNAKLNLMLKAQWLVCKDVCVPEKGDFNLTLAVSPAGQQPDLSADAAQLDAMVMKLPAMIADPVSFQAQDGNVHFSVELPGGLKTTPKSVLFFPATDGIIANTADQQYTVNGNVVAFTIKQGDNTSIEAGDGLVSVTRDDGSHSDFSITLQKGAAAAATAPATSLPAPLVTTAPAESHSPMAPVNTGTLINSLLFALLGGLILNLMPCVLPILSLKVLSVVKKGKSHASAVRKQALAYTAGVVLSFMLMALLLIALQKAAGGVLGWGFQMQSPIFVSLLALLMLLVGLNLSGVFELPVLLGNVGNKKASEDSPLGSFLTGVLAVMVATPCSAPFMAPAIGFALTQSIPVVMMVFAALGFGLAVPFLLFSIFPGLATFLPKPGMWMVTLRQFLAFPIYLTVVWLVWVLGSEAGPNGVGVAMIAMVAVVFCIFLLHRKSKLLKLFAVLIAMCSVFAILHYVRPMARERMANTALMEQFSLDRIAELRAQGKAVFVDATADWCITCKVNEAVALSKPEVKAAFANQKIVMMIADWTRGDMAITNYLKSFERSGVPIYVYYPANGGAPKVLPQILTPDIVLDAIHE